MNIECPSLGIDREGEGPFTSIIPKTRVHYYIPPTLNCAAHNQYVVYEGHA